MSNKEKIIISFTQIAPAYLVEPIIKFNPENEAEVIELISHRNIFKDTYFSDNDFFDLNKMGELKLKYVDAKVKIDYKNCLDLIREISKFSLRDITLVGKYSTTDGYGPFIDIIIIKNSGASSKRYELNKGFWSPSEIIENLLNLDPKNRGFRRFLANYTLQSPRFEKKFDECIQKAMSYDSEYPNIYYHLGLKFLRKQKYEEAKSNFLKAISLDSDQDYKNINSLEFSNIYLALSQIEHIKSSFLY